MRLHTGALCALLFLNLSAEARWQEVFVPLSGPAALQDLAELGIDLDPCGMTLEEGGLRMPLQEQEVGQLVRAGFLPQVLQADLEAHYASRLGASRDFGAYFTVSEGYSAIWQLHNDYPGLVAAPDTIGYSLEGNPILAVKLSDNPELEEDEPELLYTSLIHAREAITLSQLLDFATHLCENYGSDDRVTHLVDNREFWFVPVVNPDGVLYNEQIAPGGGGLWRKNRRDNGDGTIGVDLNRNFGFMWGFDDFGSSPFGNDATFRGSGPFSEPALQVLRDFVGQREFRMALNYHSYSNLYLHPWDFEESYPPTADLEFFRDLCHTMADHNGYAVGTAWELLYPVNGAAGDWFYGDTLHHEKCFSITPEVGSSSDGFWPQESRIPALLAASLEPNLRFAEMAEDCDGSGLPDALEARMGLLEDCNGNGLADLCEIADSLVADCDGNGVPDACESQYCDGLILFEDFEAESGWSVGADGDDATTGLWVRVDPNGSEAQSEDDHTPAGSQCFVTGQAAPGAGQGSNDVDGGRTTLNSPSYDLSAYDDPWCEYWRWYQNSTGDNPDADLFEVELSVDGGGTWFPVETVGPAGTESAGGWRSFRFRIGEIAPAGADTRFRFIASDEGGGSIVEAALDDFALFQTSGCSDPTPLAPLLGISRQGSDILLDWEPVVESQAGCPLEGVLYTLWERADGGDWLELGTTATTVWVIDGALAGETTRQYRVSALLP